MGVNVVETEEHTDDEEREEGEEEAEAESSDLVEVQRIVPAKSEAKEPSERTDDPVRMPAEVGQKVPQIKSHMFFLTADQFVIVDPKDKKVADVIKLNES